MSKSRPGKSRPLPASYPGLVGDIGALLEVARRSSARAVNALMTATYWEIGRRIVEFEQGGDKRAGYGDELLKLLAGDLTARFGRGFSRQNLQSMRLFYLALPPERICQTLSGKSPDDEKQPARFRQPDNVITRIVFNETFRRLKKVHLQAVNEYRDKALLRRRRSPCHLPPRPSCNVSSRRCIHELHQNESHGGAICPQRPWPVRALGEVVGVDGEWHQPTSVLLSRS